MSKNIEDYLKNIYSIILDHGTASTNEISRIMHVAPSSVTVMLKKLREKGYAEYSPYQGTILTNNGSRYAEKIIRRHRLLECFLHDSLNLEKEQIHNQACQMEHTIFDDTERALCKMLKQPYKCPDDQKVIPACDLQFNNCEECLNLADAIEKVEKRQTDLIDLSALKKNGVGRVSFVRGDKRLLHHLSESGIRSGTMVEMVRPSSSTASIEIIVGGSRVTLSKNNAFNIFVEKPDKISTETSSQATLSTINKRLEERNRQNNIINEMRLLLQSCSTLDEIPPIITLGITRLFPNTDGALFLMNNSRTYLQSVTSWGNFSAESSKSILNLDDCWGLRRGRIHEVEDTKIGPICPHIKNPPFTPYMCLPLIAKGDILGLLHLRVKSLVSGDSTWNNIAYLKEPALIFTEYISLSIANIKLWERLTDQSIRDPLTGLFNRRYIEETMQREILRASLDQSKIGIIMADIDDFKHFNDTYGHEAGDELLIKIADFLKSEIRGSDIAGRFGGEEFLMILPGSSSEGTYKRAEQIRESIKKLRIYFHNEFLPTVKLSMGIATYPQNGKNYSELVQITDAALYKAKKQGKDRVIVG
jgi:diguanylate cyclase (GGDEF)-like protein